MHPELPPDQEARPANAAVFADSPDVRLGALTLLTAALLACVVPARHAASVDPMVVLRQQ
jgi:ABC-type lipoprotein release transport system permease subunit